MFLEKEGVNPDHLDIHFGRTAENGHEGVVRMLLERDDVNPDHVDTHFGG